MRHYEIVFLVHPDQSDQTSSILSKLEKIVKDSGGKVHRLENIGQNHLTLIEIQIGKEISEDDIERLEDDFGRV